MRSRIGAAIEGLCSGMGLALPCGIQSLYQHYTVPYLVPHISIQHTRISIIIQSYVLHVLSKYRPNSSGFMKRGLRIFTAAALVGVAAAQGVCPSASAWIPCTNTCAWPNDGECDDGGPGAVYVSCILGSDCADCGPNPRAYCNSISTGFSADGNALTCAELQSYAICDHATYGQQMKNVCPETCGWCADTHMRTCALAHTRTHARAPRTR